MSLDSRIWKAAGALIAGAFEAVGGLVAMRLRQLAKQARHRRDVALLGSFDDRALADIGLNRNDVRFAASEPFWRDPGPLLVSRAGPRGQDRNMPTQGRPKAAIPAPSIVPNLARSPAPGSRARATC